MLGILYSTNSLEDSNPISVLNNTVIPDGTDFFVQLMFYILALEQLCRREIPDEM